jgi:hypothetical protein
MICGTENDPFSSANGSKDQVDMVRHYNRRMQDTFLVVDMSACFQSQVSRDVGQMPSLMRGESDKKGICCLSGYEVSTFPCSCTGGAWLQISTKQRAGESPATTWPEDRFQKGKLTGLGSCGDGNSSALSIQAAYRI